MRRALREFRRRHAERGLFRDVLHMFAGNASAQFLSLLAYPILTRLYAPAEIGVLAFFTAAAPSLQIVAALRYEAAVTVAKSDEEAGNLVVVAFASVLLTVSALTAGLLALPRGLEAWIAPEAPFLLFMPLIMACGGSNTILANEATRLRRFAALARMRFYQAIAGPVLQIVLGIAGMGVAGLLLGFVVSLASGTFGLARWLLTGPRSPLRLATAAGIREAALRHRRFPLYAVFVGLLDSWTSNLFILFVTLLYGAEIGGFVFLGERVIGRPLMVVLLSMLPVVLGESAKLLRERPGALPAFITRILRQQMALTVLWVGCATAAAPFVIPVLFGAKWSNAVLFLECRSLSFLLSGVAGTMLSVVQALGGQRLLLGLVIARLAAVGAVLAIAYGWGASPALAVLVCSLADLVARLGTLPAMQRAIRRIAGAAAPVQ